METRSSYVLVGAVALALLVGLFAFILYIARFSGEEKREFDIFFDSAITGLAVGSPAAFNGVPVGQVSQIALMPKSPQLVRVRIEVGEEVPVLKGTYATVEGVGFTGVSQVQLSGAMQGSEPIVEPGPFGVPVIPARRGGIGQLLASAPELLNNVSELTANLNKLMTARNRESIGNILANADRTSAAFAERSPEIAATIVEARAALRASAGTIAQLEKTLATTDTIAESEVRPLLRELRAAVGNANKTLAGVDGLVTSVRPGIDTLSNETLPETTALLRELREITTSLGAIAAKLDQDPAGALLGGRRLPDYVPPENAPAK